VYELWTSSAVAAPPVPDIPATAKIYVGIGKKDGATVNDLVAVLTKDIRVDRGKIGRVELRDAYSLVELPAQEAERVASALTGVTIRRKRITARVDRGPTKPPRK
jgi:ATP-dependent RNA helicase DeaD